MISYKQFMNEKFKMKKVLKAMLEELCHEDYYLNMNAIYKGRTAIHIEWFKEKAPIQIHEFRELFEDRKGDKYYLETEEQTLDKIEYWILKHA